MLKTSLTMVLTLVGALADPVTAFESGLFPGEWPPRIEAPAGNIFLRGAPSRQSRIVKTISPGESAAIEYRDVRFRTVSPGLFYARESGTLEGSVYGAVFYLSRNDYYRGSGGSETFNYTKGDSIEYLQYRAEGSAFLRIGGIIVAADLLSKRAVALKEIRRPEVELWIEVMGTDGKPLGWYQLVDDQFHQPKAGSMSPGPEFLP